MTWDKRFWVQPQSFYRIKSVHWWKFLFKNVTENRNSGPKINKNPTENRQKTDTGVGFSIFLCRFLSVLKNRQKPTKSCRFSDTKPTWTLSVPILALHLNFFRIEFYSSVSLAGKSERTEKLGQNGPEKRRTGSWTDRSYCNCNSNVQIKFDRGNFAQNKQKNFVQN